VGRLTQIGIPSSRQGDALHGKSGNMPRHIIRLQFFTLAWMLVECGVALFSAWKAHSPALLAFGSDSFVEVLSAVVVLLQFAPSFTLAPGRAASWSGIAVTIAALAVMPVLARAKRVAGEETENRALMAKARAHYEEMLAPAVSNRLSLCGFIPFFAASPSTLRTL
jgi:divalent metal cation (Fe/Co/Zn/Cd) transporter